MMRKNLFIIKSMRPFLSDINSHPDVYGISWKRRKFKQKFNGKNLTALSIAAVVGAKAYSTVVKLVLMADPQ